MAAKEKINKNPLNSDYEEKLLLDESISTPYSGEHLYISRNHTFTCVHEKTLYGNMCKVSSSANCTNSEKGFRQKLTWLKTKGGSNKCLLRR